jgi:acyl dehydratase
LSLDPKRLLELKVPLRHIAFADRDAMLYSLSAGLGGRSEELPFVYEHGLKLLPSFATVLAFNDTWLAKAGVDITTVVHGSLDLRFERSFEAPGVADVAFRIAGLTDKGAGKGGLVLQELKLFQRSSPRCTVHSTLFVRGGGGFGGSIGEEGPVEPAPVGPPHASETVATSPRQALFFRLLGDRNPLHADPAAAKAAGFERPILHGACTFAIACATVLRRFCNLEPSQLTRLAARFAGPLYPGEHLAFSYWVEGYRVAFKAMSAERRAIVLDNGVAELRPS